MNMLGDYYRNVYNLEITLTKGTGDGDEIIIVLSNPIKTL